MFDLNRIYNLDCMEAMKEIPDKFFQLAICDPPYGIGHDGQRKRVHNNPKHNRKFHARKGWDREPPPPEYFRELERVSENQIIFGGNYFAPMLPRGTKGWVVWDKGQHGLSHRLSKSGLPGKCPGRPQNAKDTYGRKTGGKREEIADLLSIGPAF